MPSERTESRGFISKLIGLIFKLIILLAIVTVVAWVVSRPATPDAFYTHQLPQDARPGALIKTEPLTKAVPPNAQGWRILYATVRAGKPALASAVVVAPAGPSDKPRSIIAWAHGTTGTVAGCAPSLLEKPFDNVPGIAALITEGWVYVGTDYPGLGTDGGHTYMVGDDAAHAMLDAVRAASQMKEIKLDDRMVVWGHSQGGNSALWTGIRATEYAPDLKLLGVAALAPASDLKGLVASSKGGMFGKIVSSYIVRGFAQAYPDVKPEEYVSGLTRIVIKDIAGRCTAGYATLFSVLETNILPPDGIFSKDPLSGPLGERLAQNTPASIIPAPVLIAQGEIDDLVIPDVQKRYVAARCSAGQKIDFRTYPGRDHVSVVAEDSPLTPELIAWTRDRFAGKPDDGNCKPLFP